MPINLDREIKRTQPDFIVHRPRSADGSTGDGGNEHFLVFDGPKGGLYKPRGGDAGFAMN